MNHAAKRAVCFFLILSAALTLAAASPGALPTSTALLTSGVISLWGGARDTIALKADHTVWTWGMNDCDPVNSGSGQLGTGACGKLGDGSQATRYTPVQVHGPGNVGFLTSVIAIMGGEHDNYALKSDGTVWAWGANFAGQLGDGTYTNSVLPVRVSGLTSVTSLGGRGYHNLAVKSDGTVWAWGWNGRGQLGHDTTGSLCPKNVSGNQLYGTCSNVPVQVNGISNPLAVTGGGFFSLALAPDRTLMGWGANERGQLGDGSYTPRPDPVHVSAVLNNVTQVSGGWKHAVALKMDGTVWTWGDNASGELGNGSLSPAGMNVPAQVPGLSNMIAVSAGDRYTAALKADGTVWTWGWNGFGQLGYDTSKMLCADSTPGCNPTPMQVPGLANVASIAARDYHTLAIQGDGSIWAWGSGENGELGNGENSDQSAPVRVLFPSQSVYLPLLVRFP